MRRGYGSAIHIMRVYTVEQMILFCEIEQEALGEELTLEANIAAVGAGTGMSGNTDMLKKMISAFSGQEFKQGGEDLENRIAGLLRQKRSDAV